MNVGLVFSFRNPPQWRVPWPEFYAEQLAQIRAAEALGYDTVWLTEHHLAEDGYSPSLLPIAAAIAGHTERIRIGTFLILLPLHNAVRVAEDAATVDILSNGRFDLGVGQGYVPEEFAAYGISRRERGSRLREGVEVIRGLWTQAPFSYEGQHYKLRDVQIMPPPVQQPAPPIWIGARGPVGVRRAARLGCHYLGVSDPGLQKQYDDALTESGRAPADLYAAQLRWVYVAPSADEAWADCGAHLHYLLTWYGKWLVAAADFAGDEAFGQVPPLAELRPAVGQMIGGPIVGSPDEVAHELEALRKTVRTTHLVAGMHLPGIAPDKARRSMELFAKEVMPGLRG